MAHLPNLSVVAVSPNRQDLCSDLPKILSSLLEGGIRGFMMREKSLPNDEFLRLGKELRALCDHHNATFILNERWELAEPMGARVVHLTWQSKPMDMSQDKGDLLVGRSIHSVEECEPHQILGLDYLVAGPVFPTPSKAGLVHDLGLGGIGKICEVSSVPVVAIGGIESDNVRQVVGTGVHGVAGISCFFAADDPKAAAIKFCKAGELFGDD
ncbi:MAG: thiamine-phosphate pyrophosphorylase [Planctomycetota bacterium]|jgi:thiamine-phosphate pyrophosphorylase